MEIIDTYVMLMLWLTLILAFIGGEVKAFRTSYISVALYGILVAVALGLHSPPAGLCALIVVSVLAPLFIRWILTKTKLSAEPPSEGIMGKAPFALIASLLTLLLLHNMGVKSLELMVGTTITAYGLVLLVSKNNLIKSIIGVVYMHSGLSISTEILYPVGSFASVFEVATYVMLFIFISVLAYITVSLYSKSGSILSKDLTKLRW